MSTDSPRMSDPDSGDHSMEAVRTIEAIPKEHAEAVALALRQHWHQMRQEADAEELRQRDRWITKGDEESTVIDATVIRTTVTQLDMVRWVAMPGKDFSFSAHRTIVDPGSVDSDFGPVWWRDEVAASYLEEHFSGTGSDAAVKIREASAKRLKQWKACEAKASQTFNRVITENALAELESLYVLWGRPSATMSLLPLEELPRTRPKLPPILARVIWHDDFKPQAERAQRLGTVGLARPVVEQIASTLVRSARIEEDASGAVELLRGNRRAGVINPVALSEIARRRGLPPGVVNSAIRGMLDAQIKAMRSLTGQRLFRLLVREAFKKAVSEGQGPGPVEIEFHGGGQEVAKRIGLAGHSKQTQKIRNALDGYSLLELPIEGSARTGHAWLLRWDDIPSRPGQRQVIRVTLNRPLTPYYVNTLPGSDRLITPIPAVLPQLVGKPANHGPQMLMHLGVFLFLTECSVELYERGSVHIGSREWQRLADEAEVPRVLLDEIRSVYVAPSSDGSLFPVFSLVEGTRTRYTLADHLDKEAAFLMEQGERRSRASESGRASARARKYRKRGRKPHKTQ